MRLSCALLMLLTVGVYSAELGGRTAKALSTAAPDRDGQDLFLTPQNNYNGWVNPEDLRPMPQCIAQQDQSTWLEIMTKCTAKRCTSHFGFICTHLQWLTHLGCLSVAFSSDVIARYLPYCGRSILAKAQLYSWIRDITGREWLVEVGDTNELQSLSPASLAEGYSTVDVLKTAPGCLTGSVCSFSREPFQRVMASCGFTSASHHTGNAARPWEYDEPVRSIIALDSETVGYDLVQQHIKDGYYFDKGCFCSSFAVDFEEEPCSDSERLDWTKQRLWLNATCGSKSLPDNWTDALLTTQFAFIALDGWSWPKCVMDMPKKVTGLTDQCAADACKLDSSGYCQVTRAVDRKCFCQHISYDSCEGSCQIFETRIDYIRWLHDLCGGIQDWQGLPNNWRQLSAPTLTEMIPWQWALKPSMAPDSTPITQPGDNKATEACPSTQWKLGSFAIINIATFIALLLCQRKHMLQSKNVNSEHSQPIYWAFKGILLATIQVFANLFSSVLVQKIPGYEEVPIFQLMLLWCSMPRLSWLMMFLLGLQQFGPKSLSAAASLLFAEILLQLLSAYYILITVYYGYEHNFYLGTVEIWVPAKIMYAGALMWLLTVIMAFAVSIRAMRKVEKSRVSVFTSLNISEEGMPPIKEYNNIRTGRMFHRATGRPRAPEEAPLIRDQSNRTSYDPILVQPRLISLPHRPRLAEVYAATTSFLLFLWIAQLLFWGGFIGLSSEEYVFPACAMQIAVHIDSQAVLRFCPPILGTIWKLTQHTYVEVQGDLPAALRKHHGTPRPVVGIWTCNA
ncbi:hypothetical protein BO85DRAFT_410277 [Aspergillus piperis CBS 112811]|uniref:Extracellular membrane protein CFEM domain-containing protein n=1 Tax=Aspergillus piperis CBS 112811 TaxID=1448313 RepID=A0A8G1VUJ6_9EURO|nr:hypothetical protein BO85DRAFT_410277 [Aspergillus piperis CBS 112811]RAH62903.1 hypothetical protein BO85DRAFT_410277 [Aspergillus piperis CBS 112811]